VTVLPSISLYNQDRLSDENFIENFVARHDVLELMLNGLRHDAGGGETEHHVLIGARGMGKTSLLRRLAIAIGADEALRHSFIPLRFREEQYNVIALDAFWRNCGEALAEWCEADGRDAQADRLDRAVDSPEWRNADVAATRFLEACSEIGARPCLLIDNLDLIFDGLKESDCWSLRAVLQKKDGPIVIGAATQYLQQGGTREAPFFEFFHPHMLEPLTEAELLLCLHALADMRGDAGAPVRIVLAREPERLRTLYTLTGGNPRILALIYQLLERSESDSIFADLEALLDQVTPFYKARIEEYQTPQQRAIIDAIALNWDPITSGLLGEVTGVEVTTISSQLSRLKRDGFIEQVPTSGARDGYQLGERFLNIWYLMRHGTRKTKQRLRWLTIFLTKLFSTDELGRMAAQVADQARAGRWHPKYCEAIKEAYRAVDRDRVLSAGPKALLREVQGSHALQSKDTMSVADPGARRASNQIGNDAARKLMGRAFQLGELGRGEDAIAVYDEVVHRFGAADEAALQEQVARALVLKGMTLSQLGRSEDAIAACDEVVHRFGAAVKTALQEQVAWALVYKGTTLGELRRSEDEIAVYDEVVHRFGAASETALQKLIAVALLNKGVAFSRLRRSEVEMAVYDEVVHRFGAADEAALQALAAMALVNKGMMLSQLGRSEDAIAACDEVVHRFGAADEAALQEQAAKALVNKGTTLGELGRSEAAIAVYDEVVHHFGTFVETAMQELVAVALLNKGVAFSRLGWSEDEIAVYDEVVHHFGAADEAALQELAAKALVNKGIALSQLGRSEDAIAACDEVVHRFGAADEAALQEQAAHALVNKGIALSQLGRSEDAIAACDEVVHRFGAADEAALQEQAAHALVNKASTLGELGRSEDEIAVYDEVVHRFGKAVETSMRELVAAALLNKGITLSQLGRSEDAITVCDEVVHRFGTAAGTALQEQVARALGNKARILFDQFGRYDEAEACYRRGLVLARGNSTLKANLAWALIAQYNVNDALAVLTDLHDIDVEGIELLNAGVAMTQDNIGTSIDHLGTALDSGLEPNASIYFEDLLWLLRITEARGHGERLIEWFLKSGHAERYAPLFGAFVAHVRGERFLLDLNPEVRRTAQTFYERISAPRRILAGAAPPTKRGSRKRTRK